MPSYSFDVITPVKGFLPMYNRIESFLSLSYGGRFFSDVFVLKTIELPSKCIGIRLKVVSYNLEGCRRELWEDDSLP